MHTHNSSNIKRKYPGHTHISFSWERPTSIWNFHQHNNTFISFVDKAIAWLPYWTYAIVTCKTNCAWHYKVIYYLRTQIFSLVNKQFNLLPTVQNLNIKIAIRNQEEYLSTSFFQYNTDMCIFLGELIQYVPDILHHKCPCVATGKNILYCLMILLKDKIKTWRFMSTCCKISSLRCLLRTLQIK